MLKKDKVKKEVKRKQKGLCGQSLSDYYIRTRENKEKEEYSSLVTETAFLNIIVKYIS